MGGQGGAIHRTFALAVAASLALAAHAGAHFVPPRPGVGPQAVVAHSHTPGGTGTRALVTACTGAPMPSPDQVITGEFGPGEEGSYVMLPFEVPAATDALRVKYCFDQPALPDPQGLNQHTIDLGLYEPDENGNGVPDEPEFRGWGGSSRRDVTLSPEGTIDPDPNPVAGQKTTVGFLPGPIPAGRWSAELGVAAVADELPSEDGVVQWRVEIDFLTGSEYSDEPYSPVQYDPAPANPNPGWYAGDLHVHARHSNPNDATMRETFSYAFCPDPAIDPQLCQDLPDQTEPGAGLDFITLSDYVTTRHWGEIGAFQGDYPGHLIVRSAEVITYRGHVNNHASADFADYRTGPIHERQLDGTLVLLRAPRPASAIFDEVHSAAGWAQINHPETFPSEVPTFGNLCRGCSWEYSDQETDYSKVEAIEVATGPAGLQQEPNPGPNPFTALAIRFWEDGIDSGGVSSNHIAAVGSSDSHNAGRANNPITQSPIGQATTVVFADELSERGIQRGVEAGHTYVKMWGNDGPDLRLEAAVPGSGQPPAIIGDTVEANEVEFTATVKNLTEAMSARPGAYVLHVVRNGAPFLAVPIPPGQDEFGFAFPSVGPSRYRLQVDRTASGVGSIEAVSSPIYHQSPQGGPPPPSAAITDVSAIEGDSGRRDASFTVSISGPAPGPVAVDYATADGSATAGGDYESESGTAVFQPGDTSEQVSIPVVGDTEDEPDESFRVAVTNPAGVAIAKGQGTGTILDDDGAKSHLGRCAQTQLGTENSEELIGTELSDRILGRGGADLILGRRGRDCLKGGTGDDRLVGGRSRDRIAGGADRDVVRATGGGFDRVRCGPGTDKVFAGPNDALRGCERVR